MIQNPGFVLRWSSIGAWFAIVYSHDLGAYCFTINGGFRPDKTIVDLSLSPFGFPANLMTKKWTPFYLGSTWITLGTAASTNFASSRRPTSGAWSRPRLANSTTFGVRGTKNSRKIPDFTCWLHPRVSTKRRMCLYRRRGHQRAARRSASRFRAPNLRDDPIHRSARHLVFDEQLAQALSAYIHSLQMMQAWQDHSTFSSPDPISNVTLDPTGRLCREHPRMWSLPWNPLVCKVLAIISVFSGVSAMVQLEFQFCLDRFHFDSRNPCVRDLTMVSKCMLIAVVQKCVFSLSKWSWGAPPAGEIWWPCHIHNCYNDFPS